MKKILIMKPDQDEVQQVIVPKERQRIFIISDGVVYLIDPGHDKLFIYHDDEAISEQLCEAHQEILKKHMEEK